MIEQIFCGSSFLRCNIYFSFVLGSLTVKSINRLTVIPRIMARTNGYAGATP